MPDDSIGGWLVFKCYGDGNVDEAGNLVQSLEIGRGAVTVVRRSFAGWIGNSRKQKLGYDACLWSLAKCQIQQTS